MSDPTKSDLHLRVRRLRGDPDFRHELADMALVLAQLLAIFALCAIIVRFWP